MNVRTSGRYVWSTIPFLDSLTSLSQRQKLSSSAGAPPSDTGRAGLSCRDSWPLGEERGGDGEGGDIGWVDNCSQEESL